MACSASIWAWLAGGHRRGDVGLGGALGGAEVGVGGAVGDPGEVAVDVAGVGLGFVAGVETLAGEREQVGAAVFGELVGGREGDVLRRQLPADVIAGEVVAPGESPPATANAAVATTPNPMRTASMVRRFRATTGSVGHLSTGCSDSMGRAVDGGAHGGFLR